MPEEKPEMTKNGLSQEELVVLLQTTLEQLDGIVKKLKTESPKHLPTQSTVKTLVTSTEAIAALLESPPIAPPVQEVETDTETKTPEPPPEWVEPPEPETPELDRSFPNVSSGLTWWDNILGGIRLILPDAINDKVSNLAITGIIATVLVLVISTSVLLFPRTLTPIAERPLEPPQPKVVATPPQLESPAPSEPIEILPPPEPEFTPEQNLIAAIQQQVIDLTSQYPEELIGSIEANFSASRLIVTLGQQWYQLSAKRQDFLAQSIFKRSQHLDFRKLEMIDSQGNLIARSPVVGNQIIIIRRQELINE